MPPPTEGGGLDFPEVDVALLGCRRPSTAESSELRPLPVGLPDFPARPDVDDGAMAGGGGRVLLMTGADARLGFGGRLPLTGGGGRALPDPEKDGRALAGWLTGDLAPPIGGGGLDFPDVAGGPVLAALRKLDPAGDADNVGEAKPLEGGDDAGDATTAGAIASASARVSGAM